MGALQPTSLSGLLWLQRVQPKSFYAYYGLNVSVVFLTIILVLKYKTELQFGDSTFRSPQFCR